MDLSIDARRHGQATVLALQGELDLATAPALRGAIQRASQHPAALVVVDLDGLGSIDDVGLGVLVGSIGRLAAAGGELVLVCTDERLLDVLHRTRLDRIAAVHPSTAAALAEAPAPPTPAP